MTTPLSNDKTYPIDDVKHAILQFAMYHYQSLLDVGFSAPDAKRRVAAALEEVYSQYCDAGGVEKKSLGTTEKRLEKVLTQVQELGKTNPALRGIYSELLSIQSQMKSKR